MCVGAEVAGALARGGSLNLTGDDERGRHGAGGAEHLAAAEALH